MAVKLVIQIAVLCRIMNNKYRVVIQFSSDDTAVQKATLAQINNLLKDLPGIMIELVIHSHGIKLVLNESHWKDRLEEISREQNVSILVCSNTMNSMNLEAKDIFPWVEVIPSAVAHLVKRQQQGWSYLKAGF